MLRVVIIDDEELSKRGIRQLVESKPDQFVVVGEASNGEQGLRMIKEKMPNLVITDIRMPYMDGLEMLNSINAIGGDIKTIIVSGHDNFEYAQRAIRMGAIDYILKPVRIKEFLTILDRVSRQYGDLQRQEPEEYRPVIQKSLEYIRQNYHMPLSLREIAERANMSESYFSKLFKTETGVNYQEYLLRYRIEKAKAYLKTTNIKIYEIAKLVGYTDEKYFHVIFKRIVGCTPVQYRESRESGSVPTARPTPFDEFDSDM